MGLELEPVSGLVLGLAMISFQLVSRSASRLLELVSGLGLRYDQFSFKIRLPVLSNLIRSSANAPPPG